MPIELQKRPGRDNWYIMGTEFGENIRQSTGTAERKKAEAILAKKRADIFKRHIFEAEAAPTFATAAMTSTKPDPEFGKRMALTRRALGHTTTEMCRSMGSKTGGSAWSNYEMGRRPMSRKFALQLCQTFGLTLEWIYRGNPKGLPKGLQKKIRALTSAHHSAPARSSASVPAAPPPATAVRAPASGTANTDRTVDLRAVAMKLAAQLPSECHNREEALEVVRLMREQANSLYDDKPLKPRR